MEAVIFDGKEYTKASVVAKKFGYTADYLGQLCRGKKVDARMVGRSWYINVDSLDAHRDTRYKVAVKEGAERTTSLGQLDAKKPRSHYLSRIDVEPILKKKTVSLYQERNGTLAPVPVKYEADDYSLIPKVNREAVSKNIAIKPAEAEELPIKQVEKRSHTVFKAEELPEVYLRGKLSVQGLEEVAVPEDEFTAPQIDTLKIEPEIKSGRIEEPKEEVHTTERPRVLKVKLLKRSQVPARAEITPSLRSSDTKEVSDTKKSLVEPVATTVPLIKKGPQPAITSVEDVKPQALDRKTVISPRPVSFKPESVRSKESSVTVTQKQEAGWFLPIVLVLVAVTIAILSLTLSIQISVLNGKYQLQPKIDFSRLHEVILMAKDLR